MSVQSEASNQLHLHQATRAAGPSCWLALGVLTICVALVYGRALNAPFVFDDGSTIIRNSSIVSLTPPLGTAEHPGPLSPPRDLPTSGRPLVNYTFALNYRLGGLNPIGYHIANALIHIANAFLLWLIVRRTLQLPYFSARFETTSGWLALAVALLWALHPLQTETVIYTTQRTELIVAFCYFATLYCSLRYWNAQPSSEIERVGHAVDLQEGRSQRRRAWLILAVVACLAGMASKEVMVSAPLVIFLFERTFIAGSAANALRRSWPLYVGLCATWALLLSLSIASPRAASAGFHLGIAPHVWWFTQCHVLWIYLKLVVWPAPLLYHYELPYLNSFADAWMYAIPTAALALAAIVLLWRNHPLGFLLAFASAILAPTFVVPVVTEMAAERRMYLPLAAILTPVVVVVFGFAQRRAKAWPQTQPVSSDAGAHYTAFVLAVAFVVVVYSVTSASRLGDYYDETLLWQQVVDAQPNNHIAHYNLGLNYNYAGRAQDSLTELQASVTANPNYPNARSALGFALLSAGRLPEAVKSIEAALAINPDFAPALNNMGLVLIEMKRYTEAIEYLEHATRAEPGHVSARINLAEALTSADRSADALKQLRIAESLSQDHPQLLYDLSVVFIANRETAHAIELLERAVKARPDFAAAHNRLGIALAQTGSPARALIHFRRLMQINPADPSACFNAANAAVAIGDYQQATPLYEEVVRLHPDATDARLGLAKCLEKTNRPLEAIDHLSVAINQNPGLLTAYVSLAELLSRARRSGEAMQVAQQGLEAAKSAGDGTAKAQLENWIKEQAGKAN